MDWVALPPEINSARMYTGPGASPLLQAASAWATLAAGLGSTSESIATVVAGLTETWLGPSSLQMAATMMTYAQWLESTSVLAGQSSIQAQAAAAAHEAAFAATVPPPVIAANRVLLASLVATNFLGINTPAIMATEAQYVEMWAQDVAAMFGYQTASTQASALPSFSPLVASVTPVNGVPKVVGLGESVFQPGSGNATTGLPGLLNFVSGSSNSAAGNLLNSSVGNSIFSSGFYFGVPSAGLQSLGSLLGFGSLGGGQNSQQTPDEPSGVQPGQPPTYPIGPDAPTVLVGRSSSVGNLSVPPSWPKESTAPVTPMATEGAQFAGVPGVPLLGGMRAERPEPARYGIRPTKVISRHPSGG